jgi:ABC-2 type transport system ATP-binding protein
MGDNDHVDAAIRTEGLTKHFGDVVAVDGLDLEVPPGVVFGFLGPNGAGKTTTIRMLLDLARPTAGRAWILGRQVRVDGPEVRRDVGYLPSELRVDARRSSAQLLDTWAKLYGGVDASYRDALVARFGLDVGRAVQTLSTGNQRKLGIVAAFMHRPQVLILDEPTLGLDPLLQREFAKLLHETAQEGRTVFLSSHVMSEVQQSADLIGVLRSGKLVSYGTPDELRARIVRTVEVQFDGPVEPTHFDRVEGLEGMRFRDGVMTAGLRGRPEGLVSSLAGLPVASLLIEEPDLEDAFLHLYEDDSDDSSSPGSAAGSRTTTHEGVSAS